MSEAGSDGLYVERPDGGADVLAKRIRTGLRQPLALAGPPGCGKSTMLSAVARRLQPDAVTLLVSIDRVAALDQASAAEICEIVAVRILWYAQHELALQLPHALSVIVGTVGPKWSAHAAQAVRPLPARGTDLLRLAVREVAKCSAQQRILLLIDGLEKAPEDKARELTTALLELRDEADLVLVIPQQLYLGPGAELVTRECHVQLVGPVWAPASEENRNFLLEIAKRRLGGRAEEIEAITHVLITAAFESGGVPRVFLQLVQDAAANALLEGRELPTDSDLARAMNEHAAGLLRLLPTCRA